MHEKYYTGKALKNQGAVKIFYTPADHCRGVDYSRYKGSCCMRRWFKKL
jgi:hypothetical protein